MLREDDTHVANEAPQHVPFGCGPEQLSESFKYNLNDPKKKKKKKLHSTDTEV